MGFLFFRDFRDFRAPILLVPDHLGSARATSWSAYPRLATDPASPRGLDPGIDGAPAKHHHGPLISHHREARSGNPRRTPIRHHREVLDPGNRWRAGQAPPRGTRSGISGRPTRESMARRPSTPRAPDPASPRGTRPGKRSRRPIGHHRRVSDQPITSGNRNRYHRLDDPVRQHHLRRRITASSAKIPITRENQFRDVGRTIRPGCFLPSSRKSRISRKARDQDVGVDVGDDRGDAMWDEDTPNHIARCQVMAYCPRQQQE